ncbi:MAG TPA: molybdenum ABC transporter ATP-binding protein [Candidatus Binataceae bacterium]|nr:molybdenum ABC transporter ATP-binding protein [Candidatus Binataceae bacterium]
MTLSVDIRKRLSPSFALEANFTAPSGITILFGRSGSGKTTLLNCIAGLIRPDTGHIALDSHVLFDAAGGTDLRPAHRAVGFLFQDLALFPHLTVAQNVEYGIAKLPVNERRERAAAVLDAMRVGALSKRKPAQISGGEKQRVALARSLVTDPVLLLLDEPLAALDAIAKSAIIADLRAWNAAHGIPIIYVTHSLEEAFAVGEAVVVLEAGKIIARGSPLEVLDAPRQETIAQLAGFENLFDATVSAIHEDRGTMTCALSDSALELEVALTHTETGARLRVAIRAGDIMIASSRPHQISARNVFAGTIASMRTEGHSAIATVDAGRTFEVQLTLGSRDDLRLQVGAQVWLVIKTYSCHLVAG